MRASPFSMAASIAGMAGAALALSAMACSSPMTVVSGGEGLDTSTIPEGVRDDYQVFAHRCSKCHSLARALNSGIDDDIFWAHYVARMRRQPASGISPEDEIVILRFLHYFSIEQKRAKSANTSGSLILPAPTTALARAEKRGAQ